MHAYLQPLHAALTARANPEQAVHMAAYMRDRFPFLGIKTPQRRALLRVFLRTQGTPAIDELPAIVRDLWQLPEREFQYCAADLLKRLKNTLPAAYITELAYLITTKSWWDTVDVLAAHPVGAIFARFPDVGAETIAAWRRADDFWLRRTTLLCQLRYKNDTDAELLFSLIRDNLDDDEFFIQKAIGWALREYSKVNATAVTRFVAATPLAPLSKREALKWLKNQAG